jgi:hypothetical protein
MHCRSKMTRFGRSTIGAYMHREDEVLADRRMAVGTRDSAVRTQDPDAWEMGPLENTVRTQLPSGTVLLLRRPDGLTSHSG